MGLKAAELARWTNFAAKGGIGKCLALCDCVAESADDLMFLKDDEIIVLSQLADHEDVYLGCCEGVVGRFKGADVQFLSKVKTPVMTKRAAVSTSKKFPIPTSDVKSPSPIIWPPRRSSSSQRESDSPERQASGLTRLISPLSAHVQSSDQESRHSRHISQSSISTASDSALNTPPHRFFSSSLSPETQTYSAYDTPSPQDATLSSEVSRPNLAYPARASTPPLVLLSKLETHTSLPYTARAPFPLNLSLESNITPLRITKRSPMSPPAASPYHTQPLSAPLVLPPYEIPDTSYSMLEEHVHRLSPSSDARVGVELSLLQSLVDGMDSDSDEGGRWSRSSKDAAEDDSYTQALSRVRKRDNLDQSTAEGLGYARSEEDHDVGQISTQLAAQATSPSARRAESPKPPISLPSPATVPMSTSFSRYLSNIDERPPPRARSTGSAGSWEDASDIYDDYFYSTEPDTEAADDQQPQYAARTTIGKDRSMSVDSDASVYTHNGRISDFSQDFGALNCLQATLSMELQPVPLDVIHEPSSLHVAMDSPPASSALFTSNLPLANKFSNPGLSPTYGGFASAMRQLLEQDHKLPNLEQEIMEGLEEPHYSDRHRSVVWGEGLGGRIVVEESDDLPSRTLAATPNSQEFPSSSPEPDLMTRQHPDPLVVVNSTPSPSMLGGVSDERRLFGGRKSRSADRGGGGGSEVEEAPRKRDASAEGPNEHQQPTLEAPPSPMVPTHPALTASPSVGVPRAGTDQRRSPFLPHPNAPKAPVGTAMPGPMYFAAQPQPPSLKRQPALQPAPGQPHLQQKQQDGDHGDHGLAHPPNVFGVIQMALFTPPHPRPAVGVMMNIPHRGPTIYGRTESDLAAAFGPVPILFSVDPPLASAPQPPASQPQSKTEVVPQRVQMMEKQLQRRLGRSMSMGYASGDGLTASNGLGEGGESRGGLSTAGAEGQRTRGRVIPRANFFPKAFGLRPRSRSFSGFDSTAAAMPLPEKPSSANSKLSGRDVKRPLTTSSSSTSSTPLHRPVDPETTSIQNIRTQLVPPPLLLRETSLRSKLSLPRRKQRQGEETTINSPLNTSFSELLHVQDMDFELVRPNLAHLHAGRTSQDSNVLSRENSLDVRSDNNCLLGPESPAASVASGASRLSGQDSPTTADSVNWVPGTSPSTASNTVSRSTTDAEASMDAHRQRELKWMALMSATPAFQARKGKKVKKLVMEGVPSSVRYLVWSYLTDSKAHCVPGVYTQLCSRGRLPTSADMKKDIEVCFQDQPDLQGTQGSALVLLQAYLHMVPDIWYSTGLTLIVGQLLLLSPEEDAFWIFVSIMNTHLRPYFSRTATQLEVDSTLFGRALEDNDGVLARKLVDMSIMPRSICQPWFSTLFASTLPPGYLNRVWDIFLFEGVPFLLRVGLTLLTCCRSPLLSAASEESILQLLLHPPQALLPATLDGFLSLAFSMKLKDDDVHKQRVIMAAQVKHHTRFLQATATSQTISLRDDVEPKQGLLAAGVLEGGRVSKVLFTRDPRDPSNMASSGAVKEMALEADLNSAYVSENSTPRCSLASSRTKTTDYGFYYRQMAISRTTFESQSLNDQRVSMGTPRTWWDVDVAEEVTSS